ncbi:hypothetical protein MKW92_045051, partial [Papaver armeniacum]
KKREVTRNLKCMTKKRNRRIFSTTIVKSHVCRCNTYMITVKTSLIKLSTCYSLFCSLFLFSFKEYISQ